MADAVAIRSNVPSMAGDSLEEMEAVLSLPTNPPSLKAALGMSTRPRDNHQPRRIDVDSTTENSFVRDGDRDVSKNIIKYDVLEDRADDRADDKADQDDDAGDDDADDDYDDQEWEEEFSNPLGRVTPRSISRRSTEVRRILLIFYIYIILSYIILHFLVCRQTRLT
jgi:hypothetical protein